MQNSRGFSLLELMVSLAIVGIIATLMLNSYQDSIRKARRSDAMQTLISMQLEQERFRSNNAQYGTLGNVWGGITTSSSGNYTLSVSNLSASTYTLTATANGDQAKDHEGNTTCSPMTITMTNGTEKKGPAACWVN